MLTQVLLYSAWDIFLLVASAFIVMDSEKMVVVQEVVRRVIIVFSN